MAYQLQIDSSQALQGIEAFNAGIDKTTVTLNRTIDKGDEAFSKMSKAMATAVANMKRELKSLDSLSGSLLPVGAQQALDSYRTLERALTVLEKKVVALSYSIRDYTTKDHELAATLKLVHEQQTAEIDAATRLRSAIIKEEAALKALQGTEAQELAVKRQARLEAERYNAALAGVNSLSDLKTASQTRALEHERKVFIELGSALQIASIELQKYESMRGLNVAGAEAAVKVAAEEHAAAVRLGAVQGLLAVQLREIAGLRTEEVVAAQAKVDVSKKELAVDQELAAAAGILAAEERRLQGLKAKEIADAEARVAVLNLQRKAMADLATVEAKMVAEEELASARLDALNRGVGVRTKALKELAAAIQEVEAVQARFDKELAIANKEISLYTSGTAKLTIEAKAHASLLAKEAEAQAKLKLATDSSTASVYKLTAATEARLAGLRQEAVFEQEMINRARKLEQSITHLNSAEGQQMANRAELERLTKRRNVLLAQETDAYRTLAAEVAKLEAAQKKVATVEAELVAEEKLALDRLDALNRGIGVRTKALKEQAAAIQEVEAVQARFDKELAIANKEISLYTSGTAKLAVEAKAHAALLAKSAEAQAKLKLATDSSTASVYKLVTATEARLAGLKQEAVFEQEMINRARKLEQSIAHLNSVEGQQMANQAELERITKRRNALLAQETDAYRILAAEVAKLEAAQRKAAAASAGTSGASSWSALGKAMKDVSAGSLATNNAIQALRSTLYGLGTSFGIFTSSTLLVSAAVYGLVTQIKQVVSVGANLEDAVTRVAAISTDAAASSDAYKRSLEGLNQRAISVAGTSRFMATEVVQAMNELAMAGLGAQEIMLAVRDVMNLAAIGSIGFGQSADIATNILMGFRLEVEELGLVVDKMALAVTSSNQTVAQLGNALSYAAPIASSFGVSLDFVIAGTEVLANSGIKASRAGTALRRILISLYTPTKKGAEALKAMGQEVSQLSEDLSGLEMLDAPLKGLAGATGDTTGQLLDRLKEIYVATNGATTNINMLVDIVGVRAAPAFAQLVASLGLGSKGLLTFMEAAETAFGTTEDRMGKMMDTLKAQWDVFRSAVEAIQQKIFTSGDVDSALQGIVVQMSGYLQMVASSKTGMQDFVLRIEDVVAALYKLGSTLLYVVGTTVALKVAYRTMTIAFATTEGIIASIATLKALTNSIVLLSTASTGAAAAQAALTGGSAAFAASYAGMLGWMRLATGGANGLAVALTLVTLGFKALIRYVALPVAVIYTVYKLADALFDLSGVVDSVVQAWKSLTGAARDASKEIQETYDTLVNEGKLQQYQNDIADTQEKLIELGNKPYYEGQAQEVEDLRGKLRELSQSATEAQEQIQAYARFSLYPQIQKDTEELKKAKKELDAVQAELATRAAMPPSQLSGPIEGLISNAEKGMAIANPILMLRDFIKGLTDAGSSTSVLTAREAELKNEIEGLNVKIEDGTTLFRAYTGTQAEMSEAAKVRVKELNAEYDNLAEQLKKAQAGYDALINTRAKMEKSPLTTEAGLGEIDAQIGRHREAIEGLTPAVEEAGKKVKEFNTALHAIDTNVPVTLEDLGKDIANLETRFSGIANILDFSSIETDNRKTLDAMTRQLSGIAALRDKLTALKLTYESISKEGATDEALKGLIKSISELTKEEYDLEQKNEDLKKSFWDVINKYDEASNQASTLLGEIVSLSGATAAVQWDTERYTAALQQLYGKTLQVSEATGQLTEESKKAVQQLKQALSGELADVQKKLADLLSSKKTDSGTIESIRIYRAEIQNLQAALAMTDSDLAQWVINQKNAKQQAEYATNAYQSQADVMKSLNLQIEATTLERKREVQAASEAERAYLNLKYVLEDLNQVQSDALKASDFTTNLQKAFDDFGSLFDDSKFGNTIVDWFDPTEIVQKTGSLTDQIRTTLQTAGDSSKEVSLLVSKQFQDLYTELDTVSTKIVEDINRVREAASEPIQLDVRSSLDQPGGQYGQVGADQELSITFQVDDAQFREHILANQELVSAFNEQLSNALNSGNEVSGLGMQFGDVAYRLVETADSINVVKLSAGGMEEVVGSVAVEIADLAASADQVSESLPLAASGISQVVQAADSLSSVDISAPIREAEVDLQSFEDKTRELQEQIRSTSFDIQINVSDNDQIAALLDQMNQYKKGMEDALSNILELRKQQKEGVIDSPEFMRKANIELETHNRYSEKLAETKEHLSKVEEELVKKGELNHSVMKLEDKQLEILNQRYRTTAAAVADYNTAKKEINDLIINKQISVEQGAERLSEYYKDIVASTGKWGEYMVKVSEESGGLTDAVQGILDSVRGGLIDALVGDGELKMDDFVKMVKRKLAELAVNTIFVNVVGDISGIGNIVSGLLGGGSSGGAGSIAGLASTGGSLYNNLGTLASIGTKLSSAWGWLNSSSIAARFSGAGAAATGNVGAIGGLSDVAGTQAATAGGASNLVYLGAGSIGTLAGSFLANQLFDGKYVGIGSALGGAAGSIAGGYVGGAVGGASGVAAGAAAGSVVPVVGTIIGAVLGAVAGGGLASLFGDDTPRFGGYATSFLGNGAMLEDSYYAQGGFGMKFGVMDKGSSNIDAKEFSSVMEGLAKVSLTLESFFGKELSATVQEKLKNAIGLVNDWGGDFNEYFRQLFGTIISMANDASEESDDAARLLSQTVFELGGLTGTAAQMTQTIEDALAAVAGAKGIFDTELGEILGMFEDGVYNSLSSATSAFTGWMVSLQAEGETLSNTIANLGVDMALLSKVFTATGKGFSEITNSGLAFIEAAKSMAAQLEYYGTNIDDFSAMLDNYYNNFLTDGEKALLTQESALKAITAFNEEMGFTGDNFIETKQELKDFISSLMDSGAAMTESGRDALIQAMLVSDAILQLDTAMQTLYGITTDVSGAITDFIGSITPDSVYTQQAIDMFKEWNLPFPATSEALYKMIQAGVFTTKQLYELSQASETLKTAWDHIASFSGAAIDELKSKYDLKKTAENTRYDKEVKGIRDAYDENKKALEKAHTARIDELNKQLSELKDSIGVFSDATKAAGEAIRNLMKINEGIDKTRQRYLEEAKGILDIIKSGGMVLPDYYNEVISGLGNIDPNDFATKAEYEAAIAENMAMLEALRNAAGGKENEYQAQIDAIEKAIENENDLYEKAKQDADDRLEEDLKAAEDRHNANLDAMDAEFNSLKTQIEEASLPQLLELLKSNGLLTDQIGLLEALVASMGLANGNGSFFSDEDLKGISDAINDGWEIKPLTDEDLQLLSTSIADPVAEAIAKDHQASVDLLLEVQRWNIEAAIIRQQEAAAALYGLISDTLINPGIVDIRQALLDIVAGLGQALPIWLAAPARHAELLSEIEGDLTRAVLYLEDALTGSMKTLTESLAELNQTFIDQLGELLSTLVPAPETPDPESEASRQVAEKVAAQMAVNDEAAGERDAAMAEELAAIVLELQQLRDDVVKSSKSVAENTAKSAAMLQRWEEIGTPQMRNDLYDEPYKVTTV